MDAEAFDRKYVRRDALIKGLKMQIYLADKYGHDAQSCLTRLLENVEYGVYNPSYRSKRDSIKRAEKKLASVSDRINEPNEAEWF